MLNKEQKDKLKLIVEAIDDKLTKEGYIFTARHFDVVMDGMSQVLQQTPCKTQCVHPYASIIGEEHGSPKCLACGERL